MTGKKFELIFNKEKYVADYRGIIIHLMIDNECLVDDILAKYYCGDSFDKRREFIHTILGQEQFGLMRKRDLIMYLLTNNYPEFLDKNKDLHSEGFGGFFKELIELRNICAHRRYISDFSEVKEEFTFSLDHYSTSSHSIKVKRHIRKESDTPKEVLKCYKLKEKLQDIKSLLGFAVNGGD